ncbi:MAG: sodium:calcium antiporter [Rhodobacteraceae bacterium]|nr:sodium:calcium antiporter [Paracoccaceae bacterium]
MDWLYILAGFACLLIGGEALVSGAVSLAKRLGIPPMVIGLTLVGFGTSTPELVTSVQAALKGSPGIAVGNVVGSNIANILLILGVSALLAPIAVERLAFRRDGTGLILGTVLALALMLQGTLGAGSGMVLLLGLGVYLAASFLIRVPGDAAPAEAGPVRSPALSLLWFVGGLALVLAGAHVLVLGAVGVARDLGVSETVIGLTIVAVGTSLPELVTSVIAARKGESDVALGNILGSNVFNLLGILGITALVTPLEVPPEILTGDLWIMLAVTVALIAACLTRVGISRKEGAGFLAGYGAYLWWLAA